MLKPTSRVSHILTHTHKRARVLVTKYICGEIHREEDTRRTQFEKKKKKTRDRYIGCANARKQTPLDRVNLTN